MSGRAALDAEWLRQTVERYEGPLVRFACRITGEIEKARDVVQDVFIRLCEADRAEVESQLAAWLYTVCRNRALDLLRKEGRMNQLSEVALDDMASPEAGPLDAAEKEQATVSILGVLRTLPARQQEVIRLKFQEELSYREISRITGLSISNVGFLIHVGMTAIRERLKDR